MYSSIMCFVSYYGDNRSFGAAITTMFAAVRSYVVLVQRARCAWHLVIVIW